MQTGTRDGLQRVKNHLESVVEKLFNEKGEDKTPIVEVDGIKYIYLICADNTSNAAHRFH